MRTAIVLAAILFIPSVAFSDTIIVPDDYTTIQAAINAAVDGDTVLVKPGTYVENIDFKGKGISLISEKGAGSTVIDGNQAGSVVTCKTGEGQDSVLDGFTITNGKANHGGGMYNWDSSPTVTNCIFSGNSAVAGGGGMFNDFSSPTVTNCIFADNSISGKGDGGGMGNYDSSPTVTNCTFSGNDTFGSGGGMLNDYTSNPTVTNCIFIGNEGTLGIGGMANWTGSSTVTNCIFSGNIGGFIGGMNCGNNSTVTNCIFIGNEGYLDCGGMFGGSPTNCIFFGNRGGSGGGMNCGGSSTVTNCIFIGNEASIGGGIYCRSSSPTITNAIFWNNDAPEGPEIWIGDSSYPSTLTISYSDVKGGQSSVYVEPGSTLNWGPGMIDSDPLFVDEANGDLHLTFNSPCRGSGDNSAVTEPTDFEGDPRICHGTVDMGADECYTHLYYTGDATPGGSVELKFIDLPGASPVGFWIAFNALDTPIPGAYGDWWLLPPMWGPFTLPAIPSNGVYVLPGTIPASPPGPYTLYLQAIMGTPMKLSNLCVMDVE